ncbi:MAG: hypothetical protein ACPLRW_07245 [Moorellales bacterium]
MTRKPAELKNLEVKEAYGKTVILNATYAYMPVGGNSPVTSTQEIRCNLWEKNGLRRLYLDGRDGRLGYWDVDRETWRPQDARQEYLVQVIQAIAQAALEEIEREKTRQEEVKYRIAQAAWRAKGL